MTPKIKYQFSAEMWQHSPNGGWTFVSLPQDMSEEIRGNLRWQEEGWGRLKAKAKVGNTEWDTAIWFDSKMKTYLLPVKGEVRKKEKLQLQQILQVVIWV